MQLKYPWRKFLVNFRVFSSCKIVSFELSIYCVPVLKDVKLLPKVTKSEI